MPSSSEFQVEKLLINLVHDLRQPLGNIELSTYHLNLLLPDSQAKVLEQLRAIDQQVEQAAQILSEAAADLLRLHGRGSGDDSLKLTKSATAGVT